MHGQPIIDLEEIKELISIIGSPFIGNKIHIVNQQMSIIMHELQQPIYGVKLVTNAIGPGIQLVGAGMETLSYYGVVYEFFNRITVGGLDKEACDHVNASFVKGITEETLITDKYLACAVLSYIASNPALTLSSQAAARVNFLVNKNFAQLPLSLALAVNVYRQETIRLANLANSGLFATEMRDLADRMYGVTEQSEEHDSLVEEGVAMQKILQSTLTTAQKNELYAIFVSIANKIAKRYSEAPIPEDLPFPLPYDDSTEPPCDCCACCKDKDTQTPPVTGETDDTNGAGESNGG